MASTTPPVEFWLPRPSARIDREALTTWVLSRVAVMVAAFAALWALADTKAGDVPSFLGRWNHWDTSLFLDVAKFGYRGYRTHTTDVHLEAFFPGEPIWTMLAAALVMAIAAAAMLRVRTGETAHL